MRLRDANPATLRLVLINPPHTAIGSRVPDDHLPPLGLLAVGGPLLDAGHTVELVDADRLALSLEQIVACVSRLAPDFILIGHSGSSTAHPTVVQLARLLKQAGTAPVIYGGVHPSYFWDEILTAHTDIDFIVRGEGEATTRSLLEALHHGHALSGVRGIAYRQDGQAFATPAAEMIEDLDRYRIGWELIDHRDYSYWGGRRAVVAQFSRGCPHPCTYCGQRGFWTRWRHRDPIRFARELARLYREHGVTLINFADELPTGSRRHWRAFLEALIAEDVPLLLVGSTRADDIVRDHDILHLYRRAGVIRFLLGIESYDPATLTRIRKGAQPATDRQAIALMRAHGILSMATYVLGFREEGLSDYWRSFRQLVLYDPDQIQLLYATPHRWTPFYTSVERRRVVEPDLRKWDFKHQILEVPGIPRALVFLCFKLIEVSVQLRPKVIWRTFTHPDPEYRHAMRWYTRIGRRVWLREVFEFLGSVWRRPELPDLRTLHGPARTEREYVLALPLRRTNIGQDPERRAPPVRPS